MTRGMLPGLAMLISVWGLGGCAYMNDRADDAMEIIDIGVTVSKTPQFSVYASGPFIQIGSLGVGRVDGRFIGMGGGALRLMEPHYEESLGLLVWGQEKISYEYSQEEIEAMPAQEAAEAANFMRVAPLGFAQGPMPDEEYIVSCPHFIHLGYLGVVGTPRYLQALDFIVGFTGLDLLMDDEGRGMEAMEEDEDEDVDEEGEA